MANKYAEAVLNTRWSTTSIMSKSIELEGDGSPAPFLLTGNELKLAALVIACRTDNKGVSRVYRKALAHEAQVPAGRAQTIFDWFEKIGFLRATPSTHHQIMTITLRKVTEGKELRWHFQGWGFDSPCLPCKGGK